MDAVPPLSALLSCQDVQAQVRVCALAYASRSMVYVNIHVLSVGAL